MGWRGKHVHWRHHSDGPVFSRQTIPPLWKAIAGGSSYPASSSVARRPRKGICPTTILLSSHSAHCSAKGLTAVEDSPRGNTEAFAGARKGQHVPGSRRRKRFPLVYSFRESLPVLDKVKHHPAQSTVKRGFDQGMKPLKVYDIVDYCTFTSIHERRQA
jgi:hypothetical protein